MVFHISCLFLCVFSFSYFLLIWARSCAFCVLLDWFILLARFLIELMGFSIPSSFQLEFFLVFLSLYWMFYSWVICQFGQPYFCVFWCITQVLSLLKFSLLNFIELFLSVFFKLLYDCFFFNLVLGFIWVILDDKYFYWTGRFWKKMLVWSFLLFFVMVLG